MLKKIKSFPDSPGVYIFYNLKRAVIYVGKASSLKNRVRSYFSKRGSERPIEKMIKEVVSISYVKTGSVIEAVILEGQYIKKFRPKYNILWRDDKSWNYIVVTKDKYPKVQTAREHELKYLDGGFKTPEEYRFVFGPYPGLNVKAAMKILRRIFRISSCDPKDKRPCLYRQMGECLGVCTGEISAADYSKLVVKPLVMFLRGEKEKLIRLTVQEMVKAAKKHAYEEAARLRDQLHSLRRIQDMALINASFVRDPETAVKKKLRIEGYDISNIGASAKVGAMVVFDENGPVKSAYRKFNIYSVKGQSDVDCLGEILERRFKHQDWPQADIIFIDGGKAQVNRALKAQKKFFLNIPVVGIAKGPSRKKIEFVFDSKNPAVAGRIEPYKNLLIAVRDEAHRFAISFHRQKMRKR